MKQCKRCLITKSFSDFYGQTRNKDGLRPYCKECDLSQYKKSSEAKGGRTEYHREYYQKNKLRLKLKRLLK